MAIFVDILVILEITLGFLVIFLVILPIIRFFTFLIGRFFSILGYIQKQIFDDESIYNRHNKYITAHVRLLVLNDHYEDYRERVVKDQKREGTQIDIIPRNKNEQKKMGKNKLKGEYGADKKKKKKNKK